MAAERFLGPSAHPPWQQVSVHGESALPELDGPPGVRTLPPVYPPLPHLLLRTAGRGKEAGRQKRHPHFTDLWSLRDHRAARFISQREKSKPKGGRRPMLGPGNWGSRWWAESHRGKPQASGAPGPPWLKSLVAPLGPCGLGLAGSMVVSGRSEGQGRWVGVGVGVGVPGQVKLLASGCWADSVSSSFPLHSWGHFSGHDP